MRKHTSKRPALKLNDAKLRVALAVKGKDQKDVALYLGHDPTWIVYVKKGMFRPSPQDVKKICKFLGVEADDVFDEAES